ncbi:hypothetical protein FEM48_Zijuj12G0169600 [Ziziphus jujuba var. spinosa]|uniref:Phytocyanin domain-containing protein n=1 Tax=Ziziphus jujuba var. spinosa TaxID=714518 RepID=A0A978UEJ2_ZIZJJ|nr:hypothetical protein FEM48_Zijuj12G0169600 [Ziziphus jujuba var. spinosa]
MVSNTVIVTFGIASILFPTAAMAIEYVVGDASGWTIEYDYHAWAENKVFLVGDKLVFRYAPLDHNVLKVNSTAFERCIEPPNNEKFSTGNDEIALGSPGNKWYICGVSGHCAAGQKLAITVQDKNPPTPSSSVHPIPFSGIQVFLAAIVVVVKIKL